MLEYKVAETSIVTDETLERTINEWVAKGWQFERIQFAMYEGSKRPSMAFVLFTREVCRISQESTAKSSDRCIS